MKSEGPKLSQLGTAVCLLALGLAACELRAGQSTIIAATSPATSIAASPTSTAEPSATPPSAPSFEPATYRNASAGFEFDYPADRAVGPDEQDSRGGITAFSSWPRPIDVLPGETPPGETRLDVTVQLWDPTGDLEAFLEQRRTAWDASGIAVISEERWTLTDGREAAAFVVQGSDGSMGYFFFTTLGNRNLVLSGDGDLALLAEIAHSVRPTPLEY